MTRGIDCKNPLNLMSSPQFTWKGEQKPTSDPAKRLCTFDTMEDGIRAGCVNLLSYYLQDGCETVRQIINRYAPTNLSFDVVGETPDNNNTAEYIAFMADRIGVDPDAPINMTARATLLAWVAAQIHFEQGSDCCTPEQIAAGVDAALQYKSV